MQNPLMMALMFSKMAQHPAPQSNSTNSTAPTKSASSNMLQMMMMMQAQQNGGGGGGASNPMLQALLGGSGQSSVASSPWSSLLTPRSAAVQGTAPAAKAAPKSSANSALMMALMTNMMSNNNNNGGGGGGGGRGRGAANGGRRARNGGKAARAGKAKATQRQQRGQAQAQRPLGEGVASPLAGVSQMDLEGVKAQLGGQAGIDAIYAQLGGKEAVMEMIKSGQGLPPGFKMPAAIMSLIPQQQQQGGSYDYEYYDAETGAILPPLNVQSFTQYPLVPPPSTRLMPPVVTSAPQADKTAGILNAVGGKQAIEDVYTSIGGKAGIDAIYESLGGRDAVMKMVQSGQGLPAGFKLPTQLTDLIGKISNAAKAGEPAGGYDYEYYYVDDMGQELTTPGGISSVIIPKVTTPVAPPAPLFAPPNPSYVSGGGSLFEFLDHEEEIAVPIKKTSAAPVAAPSFAASAPTEPTAETESTKSKITILDRAAAAQTRAIGRRR